MVFKGLIGKRSLVQRQRAVINKEDDQGLSSGARESLLSPITPNPFGFRFNEVLRVLIGLVGHGYLGLPLGFHNLCSCGQLLTEFFISDVYVKSCGREH